MNYVDGYVLNYGYQIYTGDLISGNTYYVFDENTNKYVVTSDTQRQDETVYYEYVPTGPSLYLPGESDFSTDFIGFSYKGVHCSELNFWRTSDGSRYDEMVIPNFSDTTAQMPGHDGILYWESFDSNRTFQIPIAFDSMSEVQYRRFRQVFNGKDYGDLIFDEAPYKRYSVKVQSPPQLKTICFMEDGQRVYKGEGSIVFVAYYPYARQVYKYLSDYSDALYPNKSEWAAASQMLAQRGNYDGTNTTSGAPINLYNCGDIPTDCKIFIAFRNIAPLTSLTLLDTNNNELNVMGFKPITVESGDSHICINTATNLIEGYSDDGGSITTYVDFIKTGTLYNKYLNAGDFFKIPVGASKIVANSESGIRNVAYNYLYY